VDGRATAECRRRYEEIRDKHPELITELFECRVGWFPILERLFDEVAFILQDVIRLNSSCARSRRRSEA